MTKFSFWGGVSFKLEKSKKSKKKKKTVAPKAVIVNEMISDNSFDVLCLTEKLTPKAVIVNEITQIILLMYSG